MSRIRSVHPGIWTDEDFVELSDAAKLLLIGLWGEADDHGIFEWRPVRLKMRLRAWDGHPVEGSLDELVKLRFVKRYELEGREFGAIRNFCKWQRPKTPQYVHPTTTDIDEYVALASEQQRPERGTALGKMLWERQGGECFYCASTITYFRKRATSLEVDHKMPISRGGDDDVANLVAACKPCNSLKGAMTDDEFRNRFPVESLVANCCEKRSSQSATNVVALRDHAAKSATREATFQMEDGGGRGGEREKNSKGGYAFSGKVIRLSPRDFDQWQESYPDVELRSALQSRDDWLVTQPEPERKRWFNSTSNWLAKRQQAAKAGEKLEMPIA